VNEVKLLINGSTVEVPSTIHTISELIHHCQLNSPVIIVEYNQTILQKQEHETTEITEGDKIELVQFVGGG